MNTPPKLESYLTKMEKALGPISVSEKAEIITEIKSHVLEALERDPSQDVSLTLSALGEPEQVASKYLLERGLKPQRPPKHPVIKWITIGFLGTFAIGALFILAIIWKFTPLVKVDETSGSVKILGGMIDVKEDVNGETVREADGNVGVEISDPAKTVTRMFETDKMKIIRVSNGAGNIKISTTEGSEASVSAYKEKFDGNCKLFMGRADSVLSVKVENTKKFTLNNNCEVNFDIKVPKKIDQEIRSGSGDILIKGTDGEIDFRVGSGDVGIDADVDMLKGSTGSGDIKITNNACSKSGKIDIKTGSGDTSIFLPPDCTIATSFRAGSGEIFNEFGDSTNPKVSIALKSGSGDLTIKKK